MPVDKSSMKNMPAMEEEPRVPAGDLLKRAGGNPTIVRWEGTLCYIDQWSPTIRI